jgi:hypothetical protein
LNTSSDGDGTKTGDVTLYVYYGNGIIIYDSNNGWRSYVAKFTPTNDTLVYFKAVQRSNLTSGTYALVCTDKAGRPLDLSPTPNITPTGITVSQWKTGEITAQNKFALYSFTATEGTTYSVWWSDKSNPSSSNLPNWMSGDIFVNAYDSNGMFIFGDLADYSQSLQKPQTFTASSNGTVYLLAYQRNLLSGSYGTYGIAVNTSSFTPPTYSMDGAVTAQALTLNTWKDGEVTSGSTQWYKVPITSGTAYNFWKNDSSVGNNTKTGHISVDLFSSTGASVSFYGLVSWNSPGTYTATANDTLYIRVKAFNNSDAGTYGLVYNTGAGTAKPTP